MPEKAGCGSIKKALNLKSRNKKMNRETAKKRTNKQTELNQKRTMLLDNTKFERNLAMMVVL